MTGSGYADLLGNGLLSSRHRLLYHSVPFAAGRTTPHPFGAFVATGLAEPYCLRFCRHLYAFGIALLSVAGILDAGAVATFALMLLLLALVFLVAFRAFLVRALCFVAAVLLVALRALLI